MNQDGVILEGLREEQRTSSECDSSSSMIRSPCRSPAKPGTRSLAAGSGGALPREAAKPTTLHRTLPTEEVPDQVEEDRGREAEGIDAIQDATVPGNERPEVLDAAIALDGGHRQPAGEAHQRDD
jgi:hypothetical protein